MISSYRSNACSNDSPQRSPSCHPYVTSILSVSHLPVCLLGLHWNESSLRPETSLCLLLCLQHSELCLAHSSHAIPASRLTSEPINVRKTLMGGRRPVIIKQGMRSLCTAGRGRAREQAVVVAAPHLQPAHTCAHEDRHAAVHGHLSGKSKTTRLKCPSVS